MVKYRLVIKKRINNDKLLPEIEPLNCFIKSMQYNFDGENDAVVYEIETENIIQFENLISINPNVISFKRIL